MISWLEKHRFVPWTMTAIIFIVSFYLSSFSFEKVSTGPVTPLATIYHISIFFLLGLFLFISSLDRKWDSRKIFTAIFLVISYAVLDELHQSFVPGRFSSPVDFLFDLMGIMLAVVIYFILIELRNKFLKRNRINK